MEMLQKAVRVRMTTKNSEQKYINPDSDGRFYELNSMVKVGCQDCEGCFKCCQGMGNSIRPL